jgi:predicted nucleic acid-binding protein
MSDMIFVDTWGWLALGHRKDNRHFEVKEFYTAKRSIGDRFYTSDYVMDELITLLFKREPFDEARMFLEGIFHASENGLLTIERITSERFLSAWALRKKFHDKSGISFTDLTSMVMMRDMKINMVLTDDDHFVHVGQGFQKLP